MSSSPRWGGDVEQPYSPSNPPTKYDIGLGNVVNERQYSASNPPPAPKRYAYHINCGGQSGMNGGWWPFTVSFTLELSNPNAEITRQNLKSYLATRRLSATGKFNYSSDATSFTALARIAITGITGSNVTGDYIQCTGVRVYGNQSKPEQVLYADDGTCTFAATDETHTTIFLVKSLGEVLDS